MAIQVGIPEAAWIFLQDLVDNVVDMNEDPKEVVILAHKDGLYNGENLIDEEAVAWVSTAFTSRGHKVSILWVDDPQRVHEWRYPPVVKAAVSACDIFINTSWQMPVEEIAEFRDHVERSHEGDPNRMSEEGKKRFPRHPEKQREIQDYDSGTWFVRLFPVTADLMCTKWAQTPSELVNNVRYISSEPFNACKEPVPFTMTDPNGTKLTGTIISPAYKDISKTGVPGMPYNSWRKDNSHYLPTPEWVHPPIDCKDVNGDIYFTEMLPWWAQYIGISPYWDEPIHITVENCKMVAIEGGNEAKLLYRFIKELETYTDERMWGFEKFHFGIHPNAKVTKYECPHDIYRRTIEHSNYNDVHWHVGSAGGNAKYNFYPHITADLLCPSLTLHFGDKKFVEDGSGKEFTGDYVVYKDGWLCCLDDPRLAEIMKKYPGRPGIPVNPNTLPLLTK